MKLDLKKEIRKIVKEEEFSNLETKEKYMLILDITKEVLIKYSSYYGLNINPDDKVSSILSEINRKFKIANEDIIDALMYGIKMVQNKKLELLLTENRYLRMNPLYEYDENGKLRKIQIYYMMYMGTVAESLIRTIEYEIKETHTYKLK